MINTCVVQVARAAKLKAARQGGRSAGNVGNANTRASGGNKAGEGTLLKLSLNPDANRAQQLAAMGDVHQKMSYPVLDFSMEDADK